MIGNVPHKYYKYNNKMHTYRSKRCLLSTAPTTTTTTTTISSPGLCRGHVKKNAFHVKGVGEIVNQTVKSDRAIAPLLKTNNSTEGWQVEIT